VNSRSALSAAQHKIVVRHRMITGADELAVHGETLWKYFCNSRLISRRSMQLT
jgi:hypothetical protein